MSDWQTLTARITPGHRVASGQNGDPRFPGGTLRMQTPHFQALGLDLANYYPGTINVSIAPWAFTPRQARQTFRQVQWHPVEPPEDFSFFDLRMVLPDGTAIDGLIYYPHPDTKPEHLQQADVLELLLPYIEGLCYGDEVTLQIPAEQMEVRRTEEAGHAG